MKPLTARSLYLATAATLFWGAALAGETLYIQSIKAKLFEAPSARTAVVAIAGRGQAVEALERRDDWVRVRLGSGEGWVAKLLVGDRPPMERPSLLGASAPLLKDEARRRASAVATAGASRGLVSGGELARSRPGEADYRALERVEESTPTRDEVSAFLKSAGEDEP